MASGHKLTNVEAQRIMAILEETCNKLELLSHIPPLELPDEDQLRDELGPDVLQVMQEQTMLEQQYELVSAPQHDASGYDANQALPDFETLDDELRHSTRVVCRMVREAPVIVERLQDIGGESTLVTDVMRKFLGTFIELKAQTLQKLSTSVEEEKSKEVGLANPNPNPNPNSNPNPSPSPNRSPSPSPNPHPNEDWFLEISAREEKASQTLRQLQKEIKAEKAEREKQARAAPHRARWRQPEPALERVLAACPLAL